ncbi:MAG: hypothetical protein GWO40_01875, partial [Gammaproteobacteria bacterium]|nr:hypothetical protein [Gammaproteobacteria bacterium]NIU03051.1 hypothetical protein [Gammaproteobacteria bacterium]NIV50573.1 hypothetical protein [Gammaproteobacteria bacterium]NIX84326.1 hypothetical protein [Gammaproteobacteria bacterium]
RDGRETALARLQFELTEDDAGGLVCTLRAPYNPFDEKRASDDAGDVSG